jgi:hypothetical protein
MKSDYWNVDDKQVIEKTGKPLAHWKKVLDKFGVAQKNQMTSWRICRKNTASHVIGQER